MPAPGGPAKILFCIDALMRGGTELQLAGLIERLDRSRWEPWLLTIRPSDASVDPAGCRRLAWDVPRIAAPGGAAAILRLARLLRRERFAVVQTYFQDATIVGGAAARLAGVPVRLACFRDMGFWRTRAQELALRPVYRAMTGYLANAAAVREQVVGRDALDRSRFKVVPNGVDDAGLPFVDHAGPTTDVGIVGNMTRRVKRTDLFVAAAGLLASRHPQVRWHVLGVGSLRAELEVQAAAAGLGDRIVFAGRVDDVPAYLERLQVGVLCSDSEGLSNAVIEYMFKGCAVVATNVGGNPELVEDGRTGLLVPPDDAPALAAAIGRLIDEPDLRRGLSAAAREDAAGRFNWPRCIAAHEAAWSGPGPRPGGGA